MASHGGVPLLLEDSPKFRGCVVQILERACNGDAIEEMRQKKAKVGHLVASLELRH